MADAFVTKATEETDLNALLLRIPVFPTHVKTMELAVKGRMKVSIAHARWDISRLFVQSL